MKNLFLALSFTMFLSTSMFAYAGGVEKEVCKDKLDKSGKTIKGKDGKAQQTCKTIKVHKKLEGTQVPPTKK